jgi:hypothetical protein
MAADVLEIYLADIRRLFNSMDPAPFRERELDPNAADYIVEWAEELTGKGPLALVVKLGTPLGPGDDPAAVEQSVREYFQRRAATTRRNLRHMLRLGRISMLIALLFLGPVIVIAESAAHMVQTERYAALIENSLVIGAWVALWRPLEIFLYDWWPVHAEAKLFDRLGRMDVRTVGAQAHEQAAAGGAKA